MALTVYSMGDLPIFTGILNSTAMVFNSSLFDGNQGAGVVVMGLLLTIVWMIFSALSQGKIDHKPLIFVFLLFYAGVMPKERLQVEDVFTGQVTAVDNIPLVVALPASLMGSLNKAITDKVETAFSTTSGSYLTMGAEGFANPLKLLLGFRDPVATRGAFINISSNLDEFVRYCAPTDPGFSVPKLAAAPDVVGYLGGLSVSGVMTYMDAAHPQGLGESCAGGQTRLLADVTPAMIKSAAESLLQIKTAGEFNASGTGSGATIAGLDQAYNSVTAGIANRLQTSQQFMLNMIAAPTVGGSVNCISQATATEIANCLDAITTSTAIEQGNVDAAAQASIFAKTMIPGMNILMALMYAFSPIIIAIAFMAGPHGMKMVLGLVVFGVWTQSWMPIAAVINFIIQLQTEQAVAVFKDGITLANYGQFYSLISMKLGMASQLLAMVPVITLTLLTGSIFGLTQMASSLSGKDYVDEKLAAPSLGTQQAMVSNGALLEAPSRVQMGSSGGRIFTDMARNSAYTPFSKLNLSETQQKSFEQASSNFHSAQTSLDSSLANTLHSGMSQQQVTDWVKQTQSAVTATDGHAATEVKKWMASNKDVQSMGKEDKELLELGLGLKVAGNGVAANKVFGMMKQQGVAQEIVNSKDFANEHTRAEKEESGRSFAKSLRTNAASVLSNDSTNQLTSAISSSERAEEKLSRSEKRTSDVGLKNEQDMQALGTLMHQMYGDGAGEDFIDSAVPQADKENYLREEKRLLSRVPSNMQKNEGIKNAAKLQALAAVNPDNFLNLLQENDLAGMHSGRAPTGANIGQLNNEVQAKTGGLNSGRLDDVKSKAGRAVGLAGSSGVGSTNAIESIISHANSQIEQTMRDKEHLGSGGQMGRDRIAAEQEAASKFMHEVEQKGWVNEHGDIAGMANFAEAGRQYANFEQDHPVAAAAIAMSPAGRTMKLANELVKTEEAVVAASEALNAAKGANNVAAAERALEKAQKAAETARGSYHQTAGVLAGTTTGSGANAANRGNSN